MVVGLSLCAAPSLSLLSAPSETPTPSATAAAATAAAPAAPALSAVHGAGSGRLRAPSNGTASDHERLLLDERLGHGTPRPGEHPGERGARDAHRFGSGLLVEPLAIDEADCLEPVERQLDGVVGGLTASAAGDEESLAGTRDDLALEGGTSHSVLGPVR